MHKQFTDEQIMAGLKAARGLVYLAARRIGCTAQTVYARAKESPAVAEVLKAERGQLVDVAEEKLFEAVTAGEQWAVVFVLRTLGRSRGYVERTEHTGADGGEIIVKVLGPGQSLADL